MKERFYSGNIAGAVKRFLKNDGWHYFFDKKNGIFRFSLNLHGRVKEINYDLYVYDDEYIVYVSLPIGADKCDIVTMSAMAEFIICNINCGMANGNFELDMRTGEIKFKSFTDCTDIIPSEEIVRNSIYYPAVMIKYYLQEIIDIIFFRREELESENGDTMTLQESTEDKFKSCGSKSDFIKVNLFKD